MEQGALIGYVEPESYADEAGLKKGDRIISINGNDFRDILEYRFLTSEYEVDDERARADVELFVKKMREAKLVEE